MNQPTEALGFKPWHPKQQKFMDLIHRDVGGGLINVFHAVAGIGSGKTIAAAGLLFEAATTFNRGHPMAWTAPTFGMIDKFIVPTWRRCIPESLGYWKYYSNPSNKRIEVQGGCDNGGSTIYLISRDNFERLRGISLSGVVEDEIGLDKTRAAWDVATGRIRPIPGVPPGRWFHVGVTTPRRGWYKDEVTEKGNPWVHWTSYENPYDNHERIKQVEDDYAEVFARQEIYAEFTSLRGLIWDMFKDSVKDGNRVPGGHRGDDFILAGDLGVHSAWAIIQQRGPDDVITAQYIPDGSNAGAKDVLAQVHKDYGIPRKAIIGQDINTRWVGDARSTPMMYVKQQWGNQVVVRSPQKFETDKMAQHQALSGRLCNSKGVRRLKVAMNLKSYHRDKTRNARGVLDVFKNDEWSETPRVGEYLPKDGKYEHMRDALMYYAVCQYPPRLTRTD